MAAIVTDVRSALDTHLTFETAAEHATVDVPVVGRLERANDVRARLVGQRYESASHIVVCEADRFLGMVTSSFWWPRQTPRWSRSWIVNRRSSPQESTRKWQHGARFVMANLHWRSSTTAIISSG